MVTNTLWKLKKNHHDPKALPNANAESAVTSQLPGSIFMKGDFQESFEEKETQPISDIKHV